MGGVEKRFLRIKFWKTFRKACGSSTERTQFCCSFVVWSLWAIKELLEKQLQRKQIKRGLFLAWVFTQEGILSTLSLLFQSWTPMFLQTHHFLPMHEREYFSRVILYMYLALLPDSLTSVDSECLIWNYEI